MKSYKMKINGNAYEVAVKDMNGNRVEVEVNGNVYNVELADAPKPNAPVITRTAVANAPVSAPASVAASTPRQIIPREQGQWLVYLAQTSRLL